MNKFGMMMLICVTGLGCLDISWGDDEVQTMLDEQVLSSHYNGILVEYLTAEGKDKLPAEQQQAALEQLVTALREKTSVSAEEQITQGLGAAVGLIMQQVNDDVTSDAGNEVENCYAGEYRSWVDAAYKLLEADYQEEAAAFFEYGMQYIPYPSLQARCVEGLAMSRPEKAYEILMSNTEKPDANILNAALRMLGVLAADPDLPSEKKKAIMEKLIENTRGMKQNSTFHAAIDGLTSAGNPRATEAIGRFKKGMTIDKFVNRHALRTLVLDFDDQSVVPILEGMIGGGFFNTADKSDQLFAGTLLIRDGQDSGFEWAQKELTPKKKSFFASKDEGPDIRPDVVSALVRYGGEHGRKVLSATINKYKDDEWLKTWMAWGLLELGDNSHAALVLKSLNNPDWDYTAIRITETLAKTDDLSGLPVMEQLIRERPHRKSAGMQLLGALAGQQDNSKAEVERLRGVRIEVANALGRINRPECVPLLIQLLGDEDYFVRSSAAYALCRMDTPAALDGLTQALQTDYGIINGMNRNPVIHAHIARIAATRFPEDARTVALLQQARQSSYPPVRFLALAAAN